MTLKGYYENKKLFLIKSACKFYFSFHKSIFEPIKSHFYGNDVKRKKAVLNIYSKQDLNLDILNKA